jgi:hypothetical protein
MRSSVIDPPPDAAWSPCILPLRFSDGDGRRIYQAARLVEMSLAPSERAVWGARTRASLAIEQRDLWGWPTHQRL